MSGFVALKNQLSGPYRNYLAVGLVLVVGFFTYFLHYENPKNLFWDENYYLTAVAKYQKGIFFEESHPPLGKLLMAAGETIINPNQGIDNDFEKDDYTKTIPKDYSFLGVRFFPTFFAWINAAMVFIILLSLTSNTGWALTLSSLYLFDNAFIVHSRAAMLDSIQLFGILLAFVAFFRVYQKSRFSLIWGCLMAVGLSWAVWTKLNGLIVAILFPLMILLPTGLGFWARIKLALPAWALGFLVFLVCTVAVWQTHFSLGHRLDPRLQNAGWYKASDELKEIKSHPSDHVNFVNNFYVELRDYFFYMKQYAAGVPHLDLCKPGENGSPFFWWPLGGKSISYRWENQDDTHVRYLYLVANPFSWMVALASLLLTFSFFAMRLLEPNAFFKNQDVKELSVLLIFYLCYMTSIAQLDRVMYLYHYLIPLVITFLMVSKWVPRLVKKFSILNKNQQIVQCLFVLLVFASYKFMSPFTYYEPLSCAEFRSRAFYSGWNMPPVNCNK